MGLGRAGGPRKQESISQKQETNLPEPGDAPVRSRRRPFQSLSQKQERTPSHPRAWRRLSQKQERTPPQDPGDASVRSRRGPFQSLETPQSEARPLTTQSLGVPPSEAGEETLRVSLAWRGRRSRVEATGKAPVCRGLPQFLARPTVRLCGLGSGSVVWVARPARPDPVSGASATTSPGSYLGSLGFWAPLCSSSALAGQRAPRAADTRCPSGCR